MSLFADLLTTVFERRMPLPGKLRRDTRPIEKIAADLVGTAGEESGITTARQLFERYGAKDDEGRIAFFRHLATAMSVDPLRLRAALATFEEGQTKDSYRTLMEAAEPARQELIRRLNRVPGATGQLVSMRKDLLRLGRGDPDLEALDLDFRHLFASWFNRGFLVLRPINWESPAHILEKIIAYEAVHAIDDWDDLRRRLQPQDRRCFAFFHPAMPDEPLIFVEVALTRGIPGSVQTLLAEDRAPLAAEEADTAVFYSISNCQAGLAGVSFGNSLIKQVAADLSVALPGLKTFVTLSPIPGLSRWLEDEGLSLEGATPKRRRELAARYLLTAKDRHGAPRDPVARFHLGNGAIVHAVHADADTSAKGMAQAGGTMVNYLYDLDRVAQNHEKFAASHAIASTGEIRALANAAETATA